MTRNICLILLVSVVLLSTRDLLIDAINPIELLEESFEAIPNFAENYVMKPLVIEKEGVDDEGNEFYEKDIIMGSGLQGVARPGLVEPRLMEAVRNEERKMLQSDLRLLESQLPRLGAFLNPGRELFHSQNDILSNLLLPQLNRQRNIVRLPFDDEGQLEQIVWGKPSLRLKPSFGVIMSKKMEDREPFESKAAAIARIEDTLNNAQNDFLSNLHHISEAEAQQAEDKKTLMDDISQFFHDYDQKARLNQAEEQVEREPRIRAQNLQQEMEKKAVEGDMGAEMSAYDVVDASYIFIELDRSIDKEDVEALLKLFSNITKVPIEYIGDINISSKLLFFKIRKPYLNTSKYVNIIGNSKDLIKERTGLKIISCGLGNKENYVEVSKQKYIDSSSENFLLVTIIICATVACVLLSLLVIFLIRRRAHLRNKLANDVSISGGKINYNDEERLITEECKGSSFSFWPFNKLKKSANLNDPSSPSQNYQDLCRSRMQGKAAPQGTNTSVLNESTPSIVPSSAARVTTSVGSDGKTESSRSSTSS